MFYLNSTLNFRIPSVFVFQLEVYYELDRHLTGLNALQTTARWYSNKTSLSKIFDLYAIQHDTYRGVNNNYNGSTYFLTYNVNIEKGKKQDY